MLCFASQVTKLREEGGNEAAKAKWLAGFTKHDFSMPGPDDPPQVFACFRRT